MNGFLFGLLIGTAIASQSSDLPEQRQTSSMPVLTEQERMLQEKEFLECRRRERELEEKCERLRRNCEKAKALNKYNEERYRDGKRRGI